MGSESISGNVVVDSRRVGLVVAVQTKIERIGYRFGLIPPRELLDACGFGSKATVTVQDKTLVVSPGPRRAREGWAEALAGVPQEELDRNFAELQSFREMPDEWDATEWQWPDTSANEKV